MVLLDLIVVVKTITTIQMKAESRYASFSKDTCVHSHQNSSHRTDMYYYPFRMQVTLKSSKKNMTLITNPVSRMYVNTLVT